MKHRQLVLMLDVGHAEQDLYGKLLWYNGFDVVIAKDGDEALGLAGQRRPDVVLLDLDLRRRDAATFCTRLRESPETASIPVVVLTGPQRRGEGVRAAVGECAACLEKPVSPLRVMQTIEELVGRPPPAGEADDRSIAAERSGPGDSPSGGSGRASEAGALVADSRQDMHRRGAG